MSENLERNTFGPMTVTITSLSPSSLGLQFDTGDGVMSVSESGDDNGTSATVSFDVMRFDDMTAMFQWIMFSMIRLRAVRNAVNVAEERVREDFAKTMDAMFDRSKAYSLHDLDHMSFQVGRKELQDANDEPAALVTESSMPVESADAV